ncbi:MAG: hypothetical protein ACE5D8_05875 [Fidelibacterota bacterium]
MKKAILILCLFFTGAVPAQAQTATLQGQIYEYATYYISSFDLQTGSSQVQLFDYTISSDSYPVFVKLYFKGEMISPSLGIDNPTTIVELETTPFQINNQVRLSSRDLSRETTVIYDLNNTPIEIHGQILDMMNPAEFDAILSSIVTSGKLADGTYTFTIKLWSGANSNNLSLTDDETKEIVIHSPVSISLESPGGALVDTLSNMVYTTYPIFNWHSESCAGCENYIRLAEFKLGVHSSVDEAIEDDLSLPFNSGSSWEPLGSFNSYQYPLSGARPLQFGRVYVWQIRQTLTTTAGQEELLSSINAFKIADMAGTSNTATVDPTLQMLQQALGDDQFTGIFGPGSALDGFIPTGIFSINNVSADQSSVAFILNQIVNQNVIVKNIRVED